MTDITADNLSAVRQLGYGIGLRSTHFDDILTVIDGEHESELTVPDWYEIISENFIDNHGYSYSVLLKIAEHYPIIMHGVSLSIGSTDPLNFDYLAKLKQLSLEINPVWISDHVCWTGLNSINSHDLLPIPLNEQSLRHLVDRVLQVQDYLQRPLVLENPRTYIKFAASDIPEWEFLNQLVDQTNCKLLLDVNNVYVSAFNLGFDAKEYICKINHQAIVQLHLAGSTHCGSHIIDTHDQSVTDPVWDLYDIAQTLTGGVSSLLEWDSNIPEFADILKELEKARKITQLGYQRQTIKTHLLHDPEKITQNCVSNPINFLMD
jgi:uncharacterized protein (UPF0276 family)